MVSVSSFFIDGPDGDELETAVALARAWAISDEYPDPAGYPGMRSARWYALNQALDDHVDVTITTPAANQFLMYDGAEWVNAAVDASVVTFTPTTLADWTGSADPGNVDDALDQLAARHVALAASVAALGDPDAAGVTYTPLTVGDWTGDVDPGNVDDALDQLAGRMVVVETATGAAPDAGGITFTPTTLADWTGGVDPGGVDDALDQLAGRVADIEGAGAPDASIVTYTPVDNTKWSGSADPGNTDDALDQLAARLTALEGGEPESIIIACSDESTALTAGAAKVTFRMPFAMTLSAVKASLSTAQTSGSIFTVDINEGGVSILGTKLTIDNTEKTSATAATAAVISDSALASDAEITIDIDQIGDGTAKGLKVTLSGIRA